MTERSLTAIEIVNRHLECTKGPKMTEGSREARELLAAELVAANMPICAKSVRGPDLDLLAIPPSAACRAIDKALASRPSPDTSETYAEFQQKRGRLPDLIEEAIGMYDDFMTDDDYDTQDCLDRIARKLRSARDFYQAAAISSMPLAGVRKGVVEEAVVALDALEPARRKWVNREQAKAAIRHLTEGEGGRI